MLAALEESASLSLHELHAKTKLPKPTLLRILATLEAKGHARRFIANGTWRRSAPRSIPPSSQLTALLLDIGGEALDELCRKVVWPSDLAIYDDGTMRILETTRRLTPFLINHSKVGRRVPVLLSGLGLAWLAFVQPKMRESVLRRLANSDDPFDRIAKDRAAVDAVLLETRTKGYGTRAKGYTPRPLESQTNGIAVPILVGGRVVACINLVWIMAAMDEGMFVHEYLTSLQQTAALIGRRLAAERSTKP